MAKSKPEKMAKAEKMSGKGGGKMIQSPAKGLCKK